LSIGLGVKYHRLDIISTSKCRAAQLDIILIFPFDLKEPESLLSVLILMKLNEKSPLKIACKYLMS
jgi:hypothetical protein